MKKNNIIQYNIVYNKNIGKRKYFIKNDVIKYINQLILFLKSDIYL